MRKLDKAIQARMAERLAATKASRQAGGQKAAATKARHRAEQEQAKAAFQAAMGPQGLQAGAAAVARQELLAQEWTELAEVGSITFVAPSGLYGLRFDLARRTAVEVQAQAGKWEPVGKPKRLPIVQR